MLNSRYKVNSYSVSNLIHFCGNNCLIKNRLVDCDTVYLRAEF